MRILFFGLISLAGMAFCGFSLYAQAYGAAGIPLPPPFSPPLPVDGIWGAIAVSMVIWVYGVSGRISFRGFYWSCALALVGFFLTYTFFFVPYSLRIFIDSFGYMMPVTEGKLAIERTAGYPLFLWGVHKTVGLHFLPPIQLFVELMAYFIAGYLLLTRLQLWRGLSVLVFAFPLIFPPFVDYSFSVLTEALFLAGFILGGGALAAALKSLRVMDFFWSGLGIALAAAVKSIGIVLDVPTFLIMRFIPWGSRWKAFIFSVLPALAVYGAMCFSHYRETGHFSPETIGGLSLLAQVSGFIDGDVADPPGLSDEVKQAAQKIINERPKNLFPIHSLDSLNQYVLATRNDYNQIAYGAIQATVEKKLPNPVDQNTFYSRLALTTIMHHPFLYLGHAGAHFYGMWMLASLPIDLEVASLPVEWRRQEPLGSGFTALQRAEAQRIRETFAGTMSAASQESAAEQQSKIPVLFKDIPLRAWWPVVKEGSSGILFFSGLSSLFLMLIYVFSKKWAHIYAAPVTLALFVNTYFFAHALFQPCLPRYAWVATPLVFFLFLALLRSMFRPRESHASVRVDRVTKQLERN
jgi:hypothetical protein